MIRTLSSWVDRANKYRPGEEVLAAYLRRRRGGPRHGHVRVAALRPGERFRVRWKEANERIN